MALVGQRQQFQLLDIVTFIPAFPVLFRFIFKFLVIIQIRLLKRLVSGFSRRNVLKLYIILH